MDWSNERYVRLFTRDTRTWLKLRWEGQALFVLLLRKVDRAGVLDNIEEPADDLSLITGLPVEHAETGLDRLMALGVVEFNGTTLVIPNFLEAQETPMSDAQRQRRSRELRRDRSRAAVTKCDEMSQTVTDGHTLSQVVTPSLPDPRPTQTKKKRARTPVVYTPDFLEWYSHYPRKQSKKPAFEAWGLLVDVRPDLGAMIAAARDYAASVAGLDRTKIKMPATWLNAQCWEDEITPPSHRGFSDPAAKELKPEGN